MATNFEKWLLYTEGLSSPQSYINWGYYYLIAASLQRRVWCPPEHRKCYPNMYVPLVGPAGVGKGNVIRSVMEILQHHKLNTKEMKVSNDMSPQEKAVAEAMVEADINNSKEKLNSGKDDEPLLIPTAADAVTYEALIQQMARSMRRINYTEYSPTHGRNIMKIYGHSSLAFCLEEMASLFRKNTESMVNFLLQAYDCGDKYEYRTKTSGVDRVLRLCLNFCAGTTPEFMQEVFTDGLLSQGFSSRAFFIHATKNRKSQFFIPKLTDEQAEARDYLIAHVKKLTALYGQIHLDVATVQWLEDWWKTYDTTPSMRASSNHKLGPYYARKNIHVMKLGMSLHFGESEEMHIDLATFQRAIDILHEEEKTMHLALSYAGANPLAKLSTSVLDVLRKCTKSYVDLLFDCRSSYNMRTEMDEVLEYLAQTKQIVSESTRDPDTNEIVLRYKIKV